MFKFFLFLILILTLAGCQKQTDFVTVNIPEPETPVLPPAPENSISDQLINIPTGDQEEPATDQPQEIEVPAKLDLAAPFVSQAPLRNWDPPYNEACEEASMLSAAKYFNRDAKVDSQTINQELLALIAWEEDNGYKVDVNAREVVEILDKYFNLTAHLEKEVTTDRIKYELAQGNLIIAPIAGRLLGNPYFRIPGPIYHMLVIRGYDSKSFITNEVGTNTKGEAYKYSYQTILNSVHDWNHELADDEMTDEEMALGEKVMVVVTGE